MPPPPGREGGPSAGVCASHGGPRGGRARRAAGTCGRAPDSAHREDRSARGQRDGPAATSSEAPAGLAGTSAVCVTHTRVSRKRSNCTVHFSHHRTLGNGKLWVHHGELIKWTAPPPGPEGWKPRSGSSSAGCWPVPRDLEPCGQNQQAATSVSPPPALSGHFYPSVKECFWWPASDMAVASGRLPVCVCNSRRQCV